MERRRKTIFFLVMALSLAAVAPLLAQPASNVDGRSKAAKPRIPATIFRDSDGNLISNDEFVDIRMANFQVKDRTVVRTLDDGTIEFRLQKIPQEGTAAPRFTGRTVDGTPIVFESLIGKVVVLNFWFIGCAACRSETPKLNAFSQKFAGNDDIKFIAMTADPAVEVRKYLKANQFYYAMITDAQVALDMFGVGGYPKNIVIGRDGKILYWRSSVNAWDKFELVVRTELEKK